MNCKLNVRGEQKSRAISKPINAHSQEFNRIVKNSIYKFFYHSNATVWKYFFLFKWIRIYPFSERTVNKILTIAQ